jgi:hypothetical protein
LLISGDVHYVASGPALHNFGDAAIIVMRLTQCAPCSNGFKTVSNAYMYSFAAAAVAHVYMCLYRTEGFSIV